MKGNLWGEMILDWHEIRVDRVILSSNQRSPIKLLFSDPVISNCVSTMFNQLKNKSRILSVYLNNDLGLWEVKWEWFWLPSWRI